MESYIQAPKCPTEAFTSAYGGLQNNVNINVILLIFSCPFKKTIFLSRGRLSVLDFVFSVTLRTRWSR